MTDILKNAEPLEEIVSPEGIEESVVQKAAFMITKTQVGMVVTGNMLINPKKTLDLVFKSVNKDTKN